MFAVLRIAWVTLILVLITAILLPPHLLSLIFRDPVVRFFPMIWHRVACWSIGLKTETKGQLSKTRPLMLTTNHSSWLDILVLGANTPLVFVAKSDVKSWPVFGWLALLQRTIFVERTKRSKTKAQVNTIASRMMMGDIVVLFPEGTTSDGNFVLPFKSALLGAAEQARNKVADKQLFIQPVSIAYVSAHGVPLNRSGRDLASWPGDTTLLPHLKDIILEGSIGVEMTFHDPIQFTEEMKRSDIAKACEDLVRRGLNASLRH